MTILGLDVSHYQGSPNWAQVKASGREFVVLKATEGTSYVDPTFTASRRNAHAAGLIVGHYHFARGGSATAEAAWFVRTIGALQSGEFLVLDWEITYAGDHVAWCKAWLDAVTAATGVAPLIYMNSSAMNGHNWMPLSGRHGLWLARYDGSTAAPTSCNCWPAAAMKQYSDKGVVPGVGSCDVNAFYGTRDQLLAYGKGGTPPTPTPPPTVQEDDMAIIEHAQRGIALLGPGYYRMLPPNEVGPALQAHGLGSTTKMPDAASFDLAISAHLGSANLGEIYSWLRGGDKDHDNVFLIWAMLKNLSANPGSAPVIDEAKLAAALLADPASVDRLGAAIAAHLKLTSS